MENFGGIVWLRGRVEGGGKNQSSPGEGGGVIRIQRSLKGSSKFYRDKTMILPPFPPLPAVNNDRPLLKQRKLLVNSVSNMTKF